ncbi:unnamed protein product, partial [Polarella glacialis]
AMSSPTVPSSMKAWQCAGYDKELSLADGLPVPSPGIAEVLVNVHYAAVDPLDWNLLAGQCKDRFHLSFPFVPGFDVAGEVVAVGPECSKLAVGDRVSLCLGPSESCSKDTTFGPAGALAEYCVCPEEQISKVPDTVLLSAVAGLPLAGLTAYQALFTGSGASTTGEPLGDVQEASDVFKQALSTGTGASTTGDVQEASKVLVLGGDRGTGHLAVQMAKAKGAVVVATVSPGKVQWMENIGADLVINIKEQDWLQLLKGQNFDLILDCVGWAASTDEMDRAVQLMLPGGQFIGITNFAALEAAGTRGGCSFKAMVPKVTSKDLDVLVEWAASGRLEVFEDRVCPFSEAGRALQQGVSRYGKVIICQCNVTSGGVPCRHAAGGGA